VATRELTEDAVVTLFSTKGQLGRLIIQTVAGGASQRAIVSYTDAAGAAAALHLDGERVLGGDRISVTPIARLQEETPAAEGAAEGSGAEGTPATPPQQTPAAVQSLQGAVVALLATGIFMGERGSAWLREMDESTGFSQRVSALVVQGNEAARRLDEEHNVTERLNSVFGGVAKTLSDKVTEVDERFALSTRIGQAAQKAEETMADVSSRALERPEVRRGVDAFNQGFAAVFDWSTQTWETANDRATTRNAVERQEPPAAGAGTWETHSESDRDNNEYGEELPESLAAEAAMPPPPRLN